jgi:hypothetical protein
MTLLSGAAVVWPKTIRLLSAIGRRCRCPQ